MRQLTLIREKKYSKRKTVRPISLKCANHVVFKAQKPILRKNAAAIRKLIRVAQTRFQFKLRSLAIMDDHIHLILCVSSRDQFANAMRFLAGQIALKIVKGKLWRRRLWSRALSWGKCLYAAELYVWRNPFRADVQCMAVDSTYILNGVLQW